MYTKLSIIALCAAASIQEVAAGPANHRHMHKREYVWAETVTDVVTDYVTVTVDEGKESATAQAIPTTAVVAESNGKGVEGNHPHHFSDVTTSDVTSSAVSSSSVTVEASTPSTTTTAAVQTTAAETIAEEPVASPTTMLTSVKPTVVAPVETPVASDTTDIATSVDIPATSVELPATTSLELAATTSLELPATTSTSSAAAATPTAASSSSSSTGKRGAAYNSASLVEAMVGLGSQISWAYNWGSYSDGLEESITYYPMLWSTASDHSSDWDANAEAAISKGSDCLLSFNEPDNAGQANMSPADAATGHINFMNKYASKARISSPAITSSNNANQGIDWLNQFFKACDGKCQVDFCTAHWYGPGGTDGADTFLQHVTDVHTACEGKPVWMTEFAAESGSTDDFMSRVVEKLESDEYNFVEKYSYFMVSTDSLMSSATELSSFGKIFAGLS
ncbi:Uu.00g071910.m01.CDS01 [Anthostomella pinea]|uniref:Uu.00g071910.m01.CDS01 n=1 Tax=Anthostomella pinea TaxID=933095 RepID=A0AAI8VV10_9PEZI|nr:Uu.00g071910.m01.CDS01 [Anthostomella pinea]